MYTYLCNGLILTRFLETENVSSQEKKKKKT